MLSEYKRKGEGGQWQMEPLSPGMIWPLGSGFKVTGKAIADNNFKFVLK